MKDREREAAKTAAEEADRAKERAVKARESCTAADAARDAAVVAAQAMENEAKKAEQRANEETEAVPNGTLVVCLKPTGSDASDGSYMSLPVCTCKAYDDARAKWENRAFRFNGTKIEDVEIEKGTVVHIGGIIPVTNLEPGTISPTFEARFTLPSGYSLTHPIREFELLPK